MPNKTPTTKRFKKAWIFLLIFCACLIVLVVFSIGYWLSKPLKRKNPFCKCANQTSWPNSRILNGTKVGASDLNFVASLSKVTQNGST